MPITYRGRMAGHKSVDEENTPYLRLAAAVAERARRDADYICAGSGRYREVTPEEQDGARAFLADLRGE